VLNYVTGPLGQDETGKIAWIQHWNRLTLPALEALAVEAAAIQAAQGPYCFGAAPTFADCLLIPQLFNARRFGVDLAPYPRLLAIEAACTELEAFANAHPSRQPEAE
jgi:maleylpyruvate isomerase